MGKISIILAENNAAVRDFLRLTLQAEQGFTLVNEAKDGLELIEQLKEFTPDMVILDLSMPRMTGLKAAQEIKNQYPEVKIIILTMHQSWHYAKESLKIGVDAYILMEDTVQINQVIGEVLEGRTYVSALFADSWLCR